MNSSIVSESSMLSENPASSAPKKSATRHVTTGIRLLMGLAFFVSGLNGLHPFLPQPSAPMSEGAMAFAGALMKTGYMMPLIFVTQLITGVFLLANRFVPLALALIAPFLVNSIAFHVFLAPSGLVMAGIFAAFELYLAWAYRKAFAPMLAARVQAS